MMIEILCSVCGKESLLKREPRYDGFKKVGERLTCAECGHEYASEAEVPFKQARKPRVFDASDAVKQVKVFRDNEAGNLCRFCKHYVVNPFVQRCSLRNKSVEATDSCPRFEKKKIASLP